MKILLRSKGIGIAIIVMVTVSFMRWDAQSLEAREDKIDRLSQNGSYIFSAGYINAAKQQTQAIINQVTPPKRNFFERSMEHAKDKLSNKVRESSTDKVVPELKKKRGTKSATTTVEVTTIEKPLGDADNNGVVDYEDYKKILISFGAIEGDNSYSKYADFNGNGMIDSSDYEVVVNNFGKTQSIITRNQVISVGDQITMGRENSMKDTIDAGYSAAERGYQAGTSSLAVPKASFSDTFRTMLMKTDNTSLSQGQALQKEVTPGIKESGRENLLRGMANAATGEARSPISLEAMMNNPTQDQKLMLDITMAVMNETDKMKDQAVSPEAIGKASNDLLQMVATVLLAQAIPDLFKETDALSIKSMFQELNASKGRIVLEYQESTKPYYNEVVKELSRNMALLQLQNILNNSMTEEELERLPRNEIDKIIDRLKNQGRKTSGEGYILEQESMLRAKYIEPNKRILEDNMKDMMRDFTRRLSEVLETAKK